MSKAESSALGSESLAAPLALLAELTHRCPLQCPYCSNPCALTGSRKELTTAQWADVVDQAAGLGILHIHLSGGEPAVRRDLEEIVAHAARTGLYVNLITSGLLLDEGRLNRLAAAGLAHVQLSFQDSEALEADRIANRQGSHRHKLTIAAAARACGLALTVNVVLHRSNLARLADFVSLAQQLNAQRLELAHVQYHGWALANRAALMPTLAQVRRATAAVTAARHRLAGRLEIDYVPPDYYARHPKACMGGWGRRFMVIAPDGTALPCHGASDLPGLQFDSVLDRPLAEIWAEGQAFDAFRGTDWMPEPCRSCARREIDWGGCRCQAFALVGDAAQTDPTCEYSPDHWRVVVASRDVDEGEAFIYRRQTNASTALSAIDRHRKP